MPQPLIVGIGGSPGPHSMTSRLLADALARSGELGARTELFLADDLADLPIYTVHRDMHHPHAEKLAAAVREADAVIIATPGYHGGISGLVKNAIDHLELLSQDVRPYLDGRAVGAIVTAAGWQAAGTALVSVRSTVHALRGWPTPFAVVVNSTEQGPDDERVVGAIDIMAEQLLQFCRWQAAAREARADPLK